MISPAQRRVGYVLERYPKYSETFIVNEILAHEAGGLSIDIFSLRSPVDSHFQDTIGRVRAAVTYLSGDSEGGDIWSAMEQASEVLPGLWRELPAARGTRAREVHQAILLAREVRVRGITRLHAHFASAATTVARLAARFAEVPYTFTAHAKDIFHAAVQADELRRKLRDAAAVVTVSDYNAQHLREAFGEDAARVLRIYNGLELDCYPYDAPSEREPKVVAVGRLVEKKGFPDLLDACTILAERGPPFSCKIIGTGVLEATLRAQAERLGLEGIVEVTGALPRADLVKEMRTASAVSAPSVIASDSNRDGLPTVLLEAMALGTPCVSTPVAGIPEVVHNGETGLLVPSRDPEALAAALERLLLDPVLRVRLAERARALVEAEFDVRRNAASLREVFEDAGRALVERVVTP